MLVVGCGYVGARVAAQLAAEGHRVFAVTRSAQRADDFAARGWTPIVADVMSPAAIAAAPPMDAMLHAVGFDRTAGVPKRDVYVDGLTNVLNALSGRCPRVVTISSSSVYGQSNGETVDERSPTEPTTESGQICLDAEHAFWDWRDAQPDGVTAIVLRLAGIYGPARMLARAESLKAAVPMSGRGDAWLNLIHGDDAAAFAIAALFRGTDRTTCLGVDEQPVRRADFYGHLAHLLGAPAPTFTGVVEPGGRGSESGINKQLANPQTRQALEVVLSFPTFREGLADAIASTPGL
ncbi:NAD dependent epimerase/dehydratase family protein [Caulifigura coniformis]|uniref:NAD dependent epimerase/dehydratase family protein n=1 Tax=Caulifigura coniformis TaxID=2527983 RepID=A0A517S8E5_9PLAN|nr:NAD dependent epimerase/dehydratase family protein [Caulifigura coniformis]